MSLPYRRVKGTRDLLPPETAVWAAVEERARDVFGRYGYREVRTPLLEPTELFVRSVGEATDIVGKEMYTFDDRRGRSLTLRPESTASVARAYLENGMQSWPHPVKLFYVGPHFRYERPQKGRYRQFQQIGAEVLGDASPLADVELLLMLRRFLAELGFERPTVLLNTVGDEASRQAFREALVAFLTPRTARLSEDSRRRLETNPLRILDSKSQQDREALEGAPQLVDHLTPEARRHCEAVATGLAAHGVTFQLEPRLVRGLDYYTHTVFEIVSGDLGSQDAIVGGGRYDGLIEALGGPAVPAIGFAIGEDRLLELVPAAFRSGARDPAAVLVLLAGDVTPEEGLRLCEELRSAGRAAEVDFNPRSLKTSLKRADRQGSRWVVVLGDDELATATATLRDLARGRQWRVPRSELAARLEEEQ